MNDNKNNDLVEISEVAVDNTKTKSERIDEYMKQIRNPHSFRCGIFDVEVEFDTNGPLLEECLGVLLS